MSSDAPTQSDTESSSAAEPRPAAGRPGFHIVGVGASAGGLDAIERLFDNMPADTGMAFVIVQHLSPDFKSLMDELLSRHTSMPIHRVEDGMQVEPDHIYLIPPKKNMVLSEGKLLLTDQEDDGALNLPIDIFFRSLAQDAGRKAVAVILSGTGSDGSRGIQEIHNSGGLVLAQDLESAGFDGMPRSAASTKIVDIVCPPERMPSRLAEHLHMPSYLGGEHLQMTEEMPRDDDKLEIFRLFRHKYGIDFSLYKPATIDRRIERRVQLTRSENIHDYVDKLETDSEELDNLYRDLLVEVTQFFRDSEAFDTLRKEVIPGLVRQAPNGGEVRLWVPGCATGEEAYSLAMMVHSAIRKEKREVNVKIFATDMHSRSLEYASAGVYPAAAMENVPEEYRKKYFTANGDLYHVVKELRQTVIFAPSDITRDPPFTKVDLISCRNVLIYLESRVQKKILSLFHFGLRAGGVLFLGPSETLGDLSNEFESIDRHWRIYRKQRDIRLPMATRMPMTPALSKVVLRHSPFVARQPQQEVGQTLISAYEQLLTKYVPSSLLVNEYFELVHSFGNARQLLIQPEGRPTLDVLKLVRGELRMALSAALHKANQQRSSVVYRGVRLRTDEGETQYKVVVEPFAKANERMFLICLEQVELPSQPEQSGEDFDAQEQSSERITVLEQELAYTRESLQSTVEELETSNEELQSTNEELIASNEELQSTNEELHSVNEELYTVNAEHKQKIDELTQLTSDMDNLLKSTEIGTVFLDLKRRIRMFTPAISTAFNVLEQDIGRPIDHIAYKLNHPNLLGDIDAVLKHGESIEREVTNDDGETYLQKVKPYRTAGGAIDGVAMTFTDVTAVKEVERAQEQNAELAQANRDLQDFAYAVSHDLQAPLRHIGDASHRLRDALQGQMNETASQTLSQINAASENLTSMIQGLLSYSRIATRGKELTPTDSEEVLAHAIEDLQASIHASGANIIREPLPMVLADDQQLKRLFIELLDNAIKYRSDRPLRIEIDCHRKNGDWVFRVADNGVGIEQRHWERVFVVFQRLGFKPEVEGNGLGLAISKRIIERHSGRIWVESTPEEGSTFYFSIPAA
ncbi:MAG: chemotaxis protein CheB [Planctomycetota bacterium]